MRKSIALNEYEEKVILEICNHLVDTLKDDFTTKCTKYNFKPDSITTNTLDLMMKIPSDLKDHLYYKAQYIITELKENGITSCEKN